MRLSQKIRGKINGRLFKECQGFWSRVPISRFEMILKEYGVRLVNEDGTPFSAIFCGEDGKAEIEIANDSGEKVSNSLFVMTWHRFSTGRYEVNAYIT